MSYRKFTYDRNILYEQVWSKAVVQVAKEYGLSDNGLRKVCKKLKVPLPRAGYWAKKQHGKPVRQPPLPKHDGPQSITVRREISDEQELDIEELAEYEKLIEFEKTPENKIIVVDSLDSLHPIVERTFRSLNAAKINESGLVRPRAKNCINTSVASANVGRAAAILDALVKALESRPFKLGFSKDGKNSTISVFGEELVIWLEEKLQRYERPLTMEEQRKKRNDPYYYYSPEYYYEPTGCLSLRIGGVGYGHRARWSDGSKQRVETILNSFFIGLVKTVINIKSWRLVREREKREEEERRRRRLEEQEQRRIEKEKTEDLFEQIKLWKQSRDIREYLSEFEAILVQHGFTLKEGEDFYDWFQWARKKADKLDPLVALDEELES